MASAPDRAFKTSKLRFIANLVFESLLKPMRGEQFRPVPAAPDQLAITWIGHSSFLIELAGRRILVDPVFARFLVVLKRRRKPGVRVRDLPPIDLVLLTHAHMDHLNLPSLRAVVRNNRRLGTPAPVVVVPRGVEDLVQRLGFRQVHALATWGDWVCAPEAEQQAQITVTMTPARHWGARMFNDTWRGYGGYVLAGAGRCVYHCGDSAYFPGFAEIGRKFRPEIALLPIGAYYPPSFRSVHTSPEDALAGFTDLGSEFFVPMHYGTFRLSLEPMEEPPKRLLAAAAKTGIANQVLLLAEGRTHLFAPRLLSR